MKPEFIASFVAAAVLHAALLFGFRMGRIARPLPMRDDSTPVEVSLVEVAPPPLAVEPPPPPKPEPTPEPRPEPMPTPAPEPVQFAQPATTPIPELSRYKPEPPQPAPQPARKASDSPRTSSAPFSSGIKMHGPATTARPRYRSNPAPEYPVEARRLHQEGVVLLNVEVGADGRPSSVRVKRSSGMPSLDQAALQAVQRWSFEPARTGGLPVASTVDVPLRFTLAR